MSYETWDANLFRASNEPDGWPDLRMVRVVETLRRHGVTTYQSCQGHEGHSDGHLWFSADLSDEAVRRLTATPGVVRVARMFMPEDCWEVWWVPYDKDPQAAWGVITATCEVLGVPLLDNPEADR